MSRVYLLFFIPIFITPLLAQTSDLNLEICNDSLFQVLKARDINTLQEREYEYFTRVDKECNQMKQINLQKEGQKAERALGAFKTIVGIMVSIGTLVITWYVLDAQGIF